MNRLPSITSVATARLAGLVAAFAAAGAVAQAADPATVHWGYAAWFGTGWYEVSDDRDVYVLQFAPRFTLREASFGDDGTRAGVTLRLPLSVGLDRFGLDDPTGVADLDNLASVSLTPGVDVTLPLNEQLTIRPFAAAGWGTVLGESNAAWTYWAGVRSRLSFGPEDRRWSLVTSAGYVGNSPRGEPSEDFWPLMAGLEFDYPLAGRRLQGQVPFWSWHVSYTRFLDGFDLTAATGATESIPDQWELGASFGKLNDTLSLGWFRVDRLGIAYRVSSSGDLEGVSLVLRSLFDR